MDKPRLILILLFASFGVSALSCAGPREVSPPVEVPEAFKQSGETNLSGEWWNTFNDPALDAQMQAALQGNLTIHIAWDRLDRAAAVVRRGRAGLFPTLDAEASAGYTYTNNPPLPGGSRSSSNYLLGLAASYELDLFGRVRSAKQATELSAMATEADLRAAAISITAEVADTWYQLASLMEQKGLIEQQNAVNKQMLDLVITRFRSGQASAADILQQEQLIESNKGDQARIESQIDVLKHRLAVLKGLPPSSDTSAESAVLVPLPALPATGLPADLLERRPDVVSAMIRVQAADKNVSAAIADRFPRISLSARASTSAPEARDLFSNWLFNLAGNLMVPIIDAGRKKAEVDIAKAETSLALHQYGQSVLLALAEVEDALDKEEHQLVLIASMEKQLTLSEQVIERIRDNYTKGAEVFMRVLDALLKHQALQRSIVTAKYDLIRNRIALYRALAGGFEVNRPEKDGDSE